PGTDGREVLRQIKTHDDTRKIPVVVLTTSIHDKDVEVCYQTGANSYVKKPTRPDDYVEIAESLKSFWFDRATLPEERQGIV
ncbi:MAG: response regulator, partial [Alphaproteobacteria bacterium]|nr:response regulator [Alphaproteobacteria bacterium]